MQLMPRPWHPYLYLSILLAVAAAVVYFIVEGTVGAKEVGTAFLATVGTFVGALFAFRLNEQKETLDRDKERKAALNRALFIVVRQYNAIRSLERQLEPYKSEFDRSFNCPAFQPPAYSDLMHEFESLTFLLELNEPNVLMRLSVEQECFHQAIESLRVRNAFYVNEVQPVIANSGFNRRAVPASEFQAALGERLFSGAVNGASVFFAHVTESRQSLLAMHGELFAAAKRLYPDAKFIKPAAEA